jgi:hypothetical protein
VTASDATVGTIKARCYAIDKPDATTTLCLSATGAPVRLRAEAQDLEATRVDQEVTADVFTPPASVASP